MTTHHPRQFPVILMTGKATRLPLPFLCPLIPLSTTGTPGTGKSTTAALLASSSSIPLVHLNISDIVKENSFHEGWDEEWNSWTLDEDRLLDHLEDIINPRDAPATTERAWIVTSHAHPGFDVGFIIDHHSPSMYPERWIDLAVVLRTDNEILYRRLEDRNYKPNKIQENVSAEIMEVIPAETRESYEPEIVVELRSDGLIEHEMDDNVRRIEEWCVNWIKNSGERDQAQADEDAEESDE
ncbi:hypothetical protein QFC19_008334 [Naganishia cerealis]|uniref:Uncharacterized protein n=1 Tax=Naganishia cerealis TaxID=610337 RepID=A0ACC2V293_9TREE|nr:hypothetical protein QFC19_008334 [Naganishia cerealis]